MAVKDIIFAKEPSLWFVKLLKLRSLERKKGSKMAVFWPVFTPFREVIRQKKPRNRSLGAYIVAYLSNHHERYGA